jgi:glucuronoxylan 4-O-methyltransferase
MSPSTFVRKVLSKTLYNTSFPGLQRFLKNRLFRPSLNACIRDPGHSKLFWMRILYGIDLSVSEMTIITEAVLARRPCRFLVFGLGNDSMYWSRINPEGETVFLEDHPGWLSYVEKLDPSVSARLVTYDTVMSDWRDLLDRPEKLRMELPDGLDEKKWDVILVDAPVGVSEKSTGRMKSIYMASVLRAGSSDVFVHDCFREVEKAYTDRYLLPGNFVEEVGTIRHYRWNEREPSPDTRM